MIALSWLITVFVIVLLVAFAFALLSMRQLPLAERPRTRTYDRFSDLVGMRENPDYHVNPGQNEADD